MSCLSVYFDYRYSSKFISGIEGSKQMHALFTLSLILIAVVESSTASEICSTVYADYHRRQLAYFSEDGVFDIESGAKHVVSCVMCSVHILVLGC